MKSLDSRCSRPVVPNLFCVAPPFCDRSTEIPPPHTKLPIQINIPYNLNNIIVVIRNNNSVKLYDDFKEQRKIMGFSEMVVPASYAPIFCIVFESCPFPPRDGQIPPPPGGGGIPPRLGTTALGYVFDGVWPVQVGPLLHSPCSFAHGDMRHLPSLLTITVIS